MLFRFACLVLAVSLAVIHAISGEPAAIARTGEQRDLLVGVYRNPPFVMCDNGVCHGMAVDLWERIASRLDVRTEYRVYPTLGELVAAGANGEVDVLVANLAVTSERAAVLRFSYPWFDSGLRILVRTPARRGVWERLSQSGHLFAYLLLFLLFVVVALAVTLFRRSHDGDTSPSWWDGFASSLVQVIAIAKSGEMPERRPSWQRSLLVAAWMIFGMGILAYVTSTVSSAMTAASLRSRGEVNELAELPGKQVAVLTGSGAESYLGGLGVFVHSYPSNDEAAAAVAEGTVTAFVADTEVLEYWIARHPRAGVSLVGERFHPNRFAFATKREHGELIERISVELILLHELGVVNTLRARYFGRYDSSSAPVVPGPGEEYLAF